jgi:NAD(P)-dependent dehydrogenase (short-subunit alcohol dehydrogenase family)
MNAAQGYYRNKVALVTGASSGIGAELAWQLSRAGAHITLAARRRELLDALAERIVAAGNPRPLATECDVTRDGDLERVVAQTVREFGKLDAVFANAGFGVIGSLRRRFRVGSS